MIYFDNSATTFYKPDCVIGAVNTAMKYLSANPGRGGHPASVKAGMLVYDTRKKLADYVGTSPQNIIFTQNCSDALNLAILGTVIPNGHIITTCYEHNSVLRPIFELQKQGKISCTIISPNGSNAVTANMIEKYIRTNTYMIITNHVSNVTGCITDIYSIGALCRKYKILYLVDGAQSIGYMNVNMERDNINLLSIAPHKGLHCVQGVGALCTSNVKVYPIRYGGTGTDSYSVYQPTDTPDGLEVGTLNTLSIAGLNRAIDYTITNFNKNNKIIHDLSYYLITELKKLSKIAIYTPPDIYNGIIAFNIYNRESEEISNILASDYNICVRSGLHCAPLIHKHLGTLKQGMIRVSLGCDNTIEEIDILLQALKEIIK